MEDSSLVS